MLGDDLHKAVAIAKRITGASKTSIAIDASFLMPGEDVEELRMKAGCDRVWLSPSVYPSGGEQRLSQVFLGKRLANGCDSLKAGAIFTNPSTLMQLADAILRDKPILERYVCVAGSLVTNPSILKARIERGSVISSKNAADFVRGRHSIVINGIFSGHEAPDLDEPVLPHSHSVIAYAEKEIKPFNTEAVMLEMRRLLQRMSLRNSIITPRTSNLLTERNRTRKGKASPNALDAGYAPTYAFRIPLSDD